MFKTKLDENTVNKEESSSSLNIESLTKDLDIRSSDRFFTESIIPRIVTSAVRKSDKTQATIAAELDINANLITMFKQGRTRVPVARAADIAKSLGINEVNFVRLVLEEHHKDVLRAIEATLVVAESEEENEAFKKARIKLNK